MVHAVHDGGGSSRPPLPADAGPKETELHGIYDYQSGIVSYTASQWRTTSEGVTDLATSVRLVVTELQRAPDGGEAWSGPAAEAAYEALGRLAGNLDRHAEDILRIESGLTAANDAVSTARSSYVTSVRAVDTDIDREAYTRTPAHPTTPAPDGQTFDQAGYDAAVAEARRERERRAATVMSAYTADMDDAARKLPVEPADSPVTDGNRPGGPGPGGSYPPGGGSTGGGPYSPPRGEPLPPDHVWDDLPPRDDVPEQPPRDPWLPEHEGPWDEPNPVVLDGDDTGGSLTPGAGPGGQVGGSTGPGAAPGGGGPGLGGAAVGMGGMLGGGAAALLRGRGGFGALGSAGRGGVMGVGNSGSTAGRGSGASGANGRGGTGAAGRSSVVGGAGGQGGRGSGGRSGGGRGGATRTGRYGVPKLGERGGRPGVTGAAGGAGSRKGTEERDGQEVEHLTTEDEETWFEGAEQATPPVWE